MRHRAAVSLAVLAVMAGGGLVACKPGSDGGLSAASPAQTDKVSAYTAVFNNLIGGTPQNYSGLTGPADSYLGADIASASPDDTIEVELNPAWLPGSLADLKKARSMRGGDDLAPVDQAADKLIASMETIMRVEKGLAGYYEGRVYKQDGLAKGKAADPELRTGYQDAMSAMEELERALTVVQRRANEARVAQLESRGHVAEASLLKAMGRAEAMTSAIMAVDGPSADKAASELELALTDMRDKKGRLKNKADEDGYDLVLDSLTDALAGYRDNGVNDPNAAELVIPFYNNAVQFSSRMSIPR